MVPDHLHLHTTGRETNVAVTSRPNFFSPAHPQAPEKETIPPLTEKSNRFRPEFVYIWCGMSNV
jgi:hypothetical protein